MKENNLDKCIRTNFRMVDNEIAVAATMPVFVVMCMMTIYLSVLALIPIIVSFVYLFRMYKKLFYTSVYGETAAVYQSLPASAAEMAAAKIFVGGLGSIICGAAYIIVILLFMLFMGADGFSDILYAFETLGDGVPDFLLPAGVISLVISAFAQSALIFLVIAAYQSVVREEKKGLYRFVIVAGAYLISQLMGRSVTILEKLGIENTLVLMLISTVLGAVIMVVCYRRTVKLLEEKYEWG